MVKGENMREKFELHCKTVGLVFFCIGAYYVLTSIPLFFQKAPDVARMVPQSASMPPLVRSQIAQMRAGMSYIWQYALQVLLISGMAPLLMGIYLMRSNNLFVRLCYPERTGPASTGPGVAKEIVGPGVSAKVSRNADDKKSGNPYAPPGYFE
jgi:hypothetical protein